MKFTSTSLKTMSLLSLVLITHDVTSRFTDRWPEDAEENQTAMRTHGRAARKFICGRRAVVIGERHRNTNHSVDEEENDDLDKIIGGRYARHGEVPWHVNIMLETKNKSLVPSCGGAILNAYWIITSAQCLWAKNSAARNKLLVIVGDHHRHREDSGQQAFKIQDVIFHSNYKGNYTNNIALVKLLGQKRMGGGIKFNDFVQPICIPTIDYDVWKDITTIIIASGMGKTSYSADATYPEFLKIRDGDGKWCWWGATRFLCFAHHVGLCKEDTGSPVVGKPGGMFVLFGIVMYLGNDLCKGTVVSTYIYDYRGWIYDTIIRHSVKDEGDMPVMP